jgi:UDP-N-acetylglucosamine transferase subunit ALG13
MTGKKGRVVRRQVRLALVCNLGGHFEQMTNLDGLYGPLPHFWITSRNAQTEEFLKDENHYFLNDAHFKRPWTYVLQIPQCIWMFARERPTHVISTGSGRLVFIPILLSLLFRIKVIHIETFSHVNHLTKLGLVLSRLRHPVFSQWRAVDERRIRYLGPIIKPGDADGAERREGGHVFVTLGTRSEPFPRIIRAVEALIREGLIPQRVIVQAGHTPYRSDLLEAFDFCPPHVIDELILGATYVITQESAGIGTKCLKSGTRMIVMPRDYRQGELPARSDMNEDLHWRLMDLGYAYVVQSLDELRRAVENLPALKVGFRFDNSKAIAKLGAMIEEP